MSHEPWKMYIPALQTFFVCLKQYIICLHVFHQSSLATEVARLCYYTWCCGELHSPGPASLTISRSLLQVELSWQGRCRFFQGLEIWCPVTSQKGLPLSIRAVMPLSSYVDSLRRQDSARKPFLPVCEHSEFLSQCSGQDVSITKKRMAQGRLASVVPEY